MTTLNTNTKSAEAFRHRPSQEIVTFGDFLFDILGWKDKRKIKPEKSTPVKARIPARRMRRAAQKRKR